MLTDATIRNARPQAHPRKLTDAHGLFLLVLPNGVKRWRYRYRIAGRENLYALGDYDPGKPHHLSLSAARAARDEARALVRQGIHPSQHRRAARLATVEANANTFHAMAGEWLSKKAPGWKAAYAAQVARVLASDVFPYIGALPIRDVKPAHLLAILKRAEERGSPTMGRNVRAWVGAIFKYAIATMRAEDNPAAALGGAITCPRVKHSRPLSRGELAALLAALAAYPGTPGTVAAIKLLVLTGLRTVEVREATWGEIDFERAEWLIPPGRMKGRQAHLVPLSRQALALLRELHAITGGQGYLFPSERRPVACMGSSTINGALVRMGYHGKDSDIGTSAHGFRATFSTFLNELGYRADLIEKQLAHAERNSVPASYNQAAYLEERRAMMQRWADFIDAIQAGDNVVPIKSKAA